MVTSTIYKLGDPEQEYGLLDVLGAIAENPTGAIAVEFATKYPEDHATIVGAGAARSKAIGSEKTQAQSLAKTQVESDQKLVEKALQATLPKLTYRNKLGKVTGKFTIELDQAEGVAANTLKLTLDSYTPVGIGGNGGSVNSPLFSGDRFSHFKINGKDTVAIKHNDYGNLKDDDKKVIAVGTTVKLDSGKKLLCALNVPVRAKANSKEGTSTPKILSLSDANKATISVINSNGDQVSLVDYIREHKTTD
jgi:hypothetical protein